MPFFTHPTSFRLSSLATGLDVPALSIQDGMGIFKHAPPHASHPDFPHLMLLVLEAVLEVVFVSLPGFIVARQGMFDAEAQKFVANLNVMVFTPCLIFTKLASQLTAGKLADLAVIPFIFILQTLISWICAAIVSRLYRFKKRPTNFVTAMAVFGNSNSLPISLVLSLSQTISGLHWDVIPGDNDDEVGARGILYLLIFQQLGQLLRWTWGYNVLLRPRESYDEEREEEEEALLGYTEEGIREDEDQGESDGSSNSSPGSSYSPQSTDGSDRFHSGERTPLTYQQHTDSVSSKASSIRDSKKAAAAAAAAMNPTPTMGNHKVLQSGDADAEEERNAALTLFPTIGSAIAPESEAGIEAAPSYKTRATQAARKAWTGMKQSVSSQSTRAFRSLPNPFQRFLGAICYYITRFCAGLWEFMNPPLWAMLVAILVASIPSLQLLFFSRGTFINNSITHAVSQSGGVAVPLILVVLGANLARNTLPKDDPDNLAEDPGLERRILVAAMLSRMVFPVVLMAPVLALVAKYVPVSIVDDPIFVIVCFLLTGAPSALQLAQICQINNVYMGAMSKLLFYSYVVLILPSTLILVTAALEVVEWAKV